MEPAPDSDLFNYSPADELRDKVALATGAGSGIGRAVAISFAMEEADRAIVYDVNDDDAAEPGRLVGARGRRGFAIKADIHNPDACASAVRQTVDTLGGLEILVDNAVFQRTQQRFEDIDLDQFRRTQETIVFGTFQMTRSALPHLPACGRIVNTGGIVGMVGSEMLVDYRMAKGPIHCFTKAFALSLAPGKPKSMPLRRGPFGLRTSPAPCRSRRSSDSATRWPSARPGSRRNVPRPTSIWRRATAAS